LKYRKKYNIAFNSKQHRNLTPLDIAIQIREDEMIEKEMTQIQKYEERNKVYEQDGKILVPRQENFDNFFNEINLDDL